MLKVFVDDSKYKVDGVLAGISAGLSILTKVNNLIPVFFVFVALFVYRFVRNRSKEFLKSTMIIAVCVIAVNIGFWVRNAIDLNGDFLAIELSFNLGSEHRTPILSKIILNNGYLFGSGNKTWSECVNMVIRMLHGSLIKDGSLNANTFDSYGKTKTFDFYPYGIHMILCCIGILYSIMKGIKKKSLLLVSYAFACVAIFLTESISVNYTVSISRYMMGAAFITFPMAGYMLGFVYNNMLKKFETKLVTTAFTFMACAVTLSMLYRDVTDNRMPLLTGLLSDYNSLRQEAYWHQWDEPEKRILAQIYSNGYHNIGIQEDVVIGEYPILYDLKDYPCRIQYVNAAWGNQYTDKTFDPDCIIYAGNIEDMPGYLEYQGENYWKWGESYHVWPGGIGLYIR